MRHDVLLLTVALAVALIACDVEDGEEDAEDSGCETGTVPTCVQLREELCVQKIPRLREGERCAGGWVAQCRQPTCVIHEDCGNGRCEWPDSGTSSGHCVPVLHLDLGVRPGMEGGR